MISIIRQAKNDYYEASDSVLIIFWVVMLFSGHLLRHNWVK